MVMDRTNAHIHWRALDKSAYWNYRLTERSSRGAFVGGYLTTVPTELKIAVGGDLGAVSYDGMVIREKSGVPTRLVVVAGATQYVVLYAKYHTNADPTLQYMVLAEAAYNVHADKNFMVVLAKIVLGGGATEVTNADIDYTVRDDLDVLGRGKFRGVVDTIIDLPSPTPTTNRDGDVYFVIAAEKLYYWDEAALAWKPMSTVNNDEHIANAVFQFMQIQQERGQLKSGVITDQYWRAAGAPTEDGTWEGRNIVVPQPGKEDKLDIANVTALLHGHIVSTIYTEVTLSAKPAPGPDRYDGIFIEVLRYDLADPEALQFDAATGANRTFQEMRETFAQFDNAALNSNNSIYIHSVENIEDNKWVATSVSIRTIDNVGQAAIYDSSVVMAAATGLGGNPFAHTSSKAVPYPGDTNIWFSDVAGSVDGVSFALPLYVVRRTNNEDWSISEAIQWKRTDDGMQQIFEVYPRVQADISKYNDRSLQRASDISSTSDVYAGTNVPWQEQYKTPSGVLRSIEEPVVGKDESGGSPVAANHIRVPAMTVAIRGHILEVPEADVDLGTTNPFPDESVKALVLLSLEFARYPADGHVWDGIQAAPSAWTVTDDQGYLYYATPRYTVTAIDSLTHGIEPVDVFDAINFLNGVDGTDWVTDIDPATNSNSDVGLLRKPTGSNPVTLDTWLQHPLGDTYSIPIALVHRRNSDTWDVDTNLNGGVSRPDAYTYDVAEKEDILDLRRYVCRNEEDLQIVLDQSMQRLMEGSLHTAMVHHPVWPSCAGTMHTYLDRLSNGGAPAAFGIIDHPAVTDGVRTIWSEAEETEVIADTWTITYPGPPPHVYSSPALGVGGNPIIFITWDGIAPSVTLIITAPVNSYLALDPITDEPIWANGSFWGLDPGDMTYLEDLLTAPWILVPWAINAGLNDSRGNPRQVTVGLDPLVITKMDYLYNMAFCAVYPRGYIADADSYEDNHGTLGNQNKLISGYSKNFGGMVNTEPMMGTIVKTTTLSTTVFNAAEIIAATPWPAVDFVGLPLVATDSVPSLAAIDPLDSLILYPRFNQEGVDRAAQSLAVEKDSATGDVSVTHTVPLFGLPDTVELTFQYAPGAALGKNADAWVELGRGSKAVSGYYAWAKASFLIDVLWLSGDTIYLDMSYFATNNSIVDKHAFFRRGAYGFDVHMWYEDPLSPNRWLLMDSTEVAVDYAGITNPGFPTLYGNVLPLQVTNGVLVPGTTPIEVWAVIWVPPAENDELTVAYQGVPYQGLSNFGSHVNDTAFTDSMHFGQIKAVSDVTVSSQGSGVPRFGGASSTVPKHISAHIIPGRYNSVCAALTYLPRLGSASWRDFDIAEDGMAFHHTPQYDPLVGSTLLNASTDPWDISGEQILFNSQGSLEQRMLVTSMPLTERRSPPLSGLSNILDTADMLKPGLMLRKPEIGVSPTWAEYGWTSGDPLTYGIRQGMFYWHRRYSGGAYLERVHEIFTVVPWFNGNLANWLNLKGINAVNPANNELYGFGSNERNKYVTGGVLLENVASGANMTIVGYLLKSSEDDTSPRRTRSGNMYLIIFTDTSDDNPNLGCAFDAFNPLFNPVLPLFPERGPSY